VRIRYLVPLFLKEIVLKVARIREAGEQHQPSLFPG
jgi:hypothetical protein